MKDPLSFPEMGLDQKTGAPQEGKEDRVPLVCLFQVVWGRNDSWIYESEKKMSHFSIVFCISIWRSTARAGLEQV